ncbi:MAG TPA: sugar ABC transporter permease [bacterium]|nr:sugar ABC transporter permease [bacterium]
MTPRAKREALIGFLLILPWVIGFLAFTAGPMLISLFLSLTRWDVLTPPIFVGLSNFQRLAQDPLFWKSLYNTMIYTILNVPLSLAGSLSLALILNRRVRGVSIFRTLFYLPELTPLVATSLIWAWVLNTHFGILNYLLSRLDLPPVPWLESTTWALPSIVLMSLWTVGGSRMLIFLAGLQGVPEELNEAAALDGASSWARLWHVILPMLSPVIFFNLVLGVILSFQVFTPAYIVTNGGPADSTLVYGLYLYRNAFQYFQMGYASSMAWMMLLLLLAFTWLQFRLLQRWVYYAGEVRA